MPLSWQRVFSCFFLWFTGIPWDPGKDWRRSVYAKVVVVDTVGQAIGLFIRRDTEPLLRKCNSHDASRQRVTLSFGAESWNGGVLLTSDIALESGWQPVAPIYYETLPGYNGVPASPPTT
jgi:hypothetical protein